VIVEPLLQLESGFPPALVSLSTLTHCHCDVLHACPFTHGSSALGPDAIPNTTIDARAAASPTASREAGMRVFTVRSSPTILGYHLDSERSPSEPALDFSIHQTDLSYAVKTDRLPIGVSSVCPGPTSRCPLGDSATEKVKVRS
jgi:hypothetical protein